MSLVIFNLSDQGMQSQEQMICTMWIFWSWHSAFSFPMEVIYIMGPVMGFAWPGEYVLFIVSCLIWYAISVVEVPIR